MSDLINRSAAIQALQKAKELASEPPTRFDIYIHKTFDLCIRLIAAFDTVDAVPVVRCKDCEYTDTEIGLPDGALYCNEWSSVVRSHWYCCRGARMDGDADE